VPALPPRALPPRPRPPPPPFPRVPEPKAQAHPRSRSLCRCCPSSPHPAFPRRRPPARQAQAQEDRSGKTSSLLFRSHPHIPHLRRHYPRRWPRCNGQQRGCPPGLDGRRTALLKQRAGGVAERSIASVLKTDEGASPPWVRIPPPPPLAFAKAVSRSGGGRIFVSFATVMREGLSTGPDARRSGGGLSGPKFSGPLDFADLV